MPDNMGAMLPLAHGPFLVASDGALRLARPTLLGFAWRRRAVEARLEPGRARLSAMLGALPSTATEGADRGLAIAAVRGLPGRLPPGWRLLVLPDHRVRLEVEAALPATTTIPSLLTALVGFALALDAYLDGLEAAGVG